jgi:hypothetical protein
VTRGAASEVVTSTYLSDAAFAHSGFRARAVDRPSQGRWVGPGMTGLLGTGPERCRSARPRVKSSGPRRVPPEPSATGAADTHCPPMGACQLGNARTCPSLAAKALAIPGGPSGNSASDSAVAGGQTGRDELGARMNPNRMGLEEQTEAHALDQGRQPSGLAGRQPRPGRADAPAAGPARLLEARSAWPRLVPPRDNTGGIRRR